MIIYTPVPPEVLWSETPKEEVQIVERMVQGVPVQLKMWPGKNVAVVERILSTDPIHFLNSSCQPGSKIIW